MWQDLAACAGMDTNIFFPREGKGAERERMKAAREICLDCPVMFDCLDYAISFPEEYGIWGSMDYAERKKYAKDQGNR